MPFAILLPLVAQAAALNGPGVAGLNLPQIDIPARRRVAAPNWLNLNIALAPSRLKSCLDGAQADPASAVLSAKAWLSDKPSRAAEPQLCLGLALALQEDWAGAEGAFMQGLSEQGLSEAPNQGDLLLAAQLGGMAGNAALAQAAPARALPLLATAQQRAQAAARPLLAASIALDQARALVALGRQAEAEEPLAQARAALPDDAQSWLLSATLARRLGKLPQAQQFIENAARLAPQDAEIGVEAGVIAMLSGHEDAARKSWRAAQAVAPATEAGQRAAAYLAQIGQ